MSRSAGKSKSQSPYVLTHPLPQHFEKIQDLCRRVYPFSKPWSLAQLESHRAYFPDGQLVVLEKASGRVIGMAFSLIVYWNDYSHQDNWQDFTSAGFFHNHDPAKGKTLYGAEVMVDPEYRGQGVGKLLYRGRQEIAKKYGLKRIRAGARLRGYGKFQEKLTPQEYVRKVVAKEIYDPTLSFQLGQGFRAIDVAANYLFNDPESLGYAAVIEWLNPEIATELDQREQSINMNLFLKGEKFTPQFLPKELRRVVRRATTLLGHAIRELEGDDFYKKVESYRKYLKAARNPQAERLELKKLLSKLSHEKTDDLLKLAHAFSLQLEVVNVCEAAYRTWRLRQRAFPQGLKSKTKLTYVLTAHPTEARAPGTLATLQALQQMLVEGIHDNFILNDHSLSTQLRKLWLQPLARSERPSVLDEADHIFSTVFSKNIFDVILQDKPGYELSLHTWVGGDKDGHPGVDHAVMKQCLQASRKRVVSILEDKLTAVISDCGEVPESNRVPAKDANALRAFRRELGQLLELRVGDGDRLKKWTLKFRKFYAKTGPFLRQHEQLLHVVRMVDIFPGFVLPIELREDSQSIRDAVGDPKQPICGMLKELTKITGSGDITHYARGFVISHCESETDIDHACKLIDKICRSKNLPVVPLFETRDALIHSTTILKNWLGSTRNSERVRRHWSGKVEVMLGYSDSAKQTGVLPSRFLIEKAMEKIERVVKSFRFQPIFFHGSGGSVARGGGSLREQVSWWARSAVEAPKMTIQGEMIQRLFVTKEILNSQCAHFTAEATRRKVRRHKPNPSKALDNFTSRIESEYHRLVSDQSRLGPLLDATPYKYLDVLRIGSRPSKRPTPGRYSVESLRAIPWVLCWTQTRALLPTWWGVGTAWSAANDAEKKELQDLFKVDPFFSSFVKALGFTLTKVKLDVWELYFEGDSVAALEPIRQEYEWAKTFTREISGQKDLIWHRPWLEESIRLRSPHIHILNLIQVLAMKRQNEFLLKETIVGIACGMLTTG
ncbi:MAG: phosphoenolpyruvate carboxylase [Bacteriovoracia bacterium]